MRPRVAINAAMSLDGRLSLNTGEQTRISSDEDMARVKRLRAWADAILVGVGTVISDDPRLTRTDGVLRVVLDTHGRTPEGALVMRAPPSTLIATGPDARVNAPVGVEVRRYPLDADGHVDLVPLLEDLGAMGVQRLLVEGGGGVIWSFLRSGLFDELTVFVADMVIGGRATSLAMGEGAFSLDEAVRLRSADITRIEGGFVLRYSPPERGGPSAGPAPGDARPGAHGDGKRV